MLPIKLSIKGLYSYQDKKSQTINFERLINAKLFGILGKVGSGKSTILEAITLALFGETEKVTSRDNKRYNLLNLKSKELYIEFEFSVDKDKYKSIVSFERRKSFESISSISRKLYKLENGNWIPLETKKIEEILKLNYKNFRRTVIIPQGKFQEFITLTSSERTKMLKEIFDLGKYDLSDKTADLLKETDSKIDTVKGKLTEIGDVKDEDLNKIADEIKKIESQIEKQRKILSSLEKKEKNLSSLKEKFDELKKAEEKYNNLKREQPEMKSLKSKIEDYEYCQKEFKDILAQRDSAENKLKELTEELEKLNKEENQLKKELSDKKLNLKNLKKEKDLLDKYRKEKEDYGKIAEILNLISETKSKTENLERVKKEKKELEESIKQKEENLKSLEEKQKGLQKKLKLRNQYLEIINWFDEKKRIEKEIEEIRRKILYEEKELKQLSKKAGNVSSEKDLRSRIKQENDDLEEEISKLNKQLNELNIKNRLIEYAKKLEEGKACPLCGSKHHPNIIKEEDITEEIKNIEQQIEKLKNRIKDNNTYLSEQIKNLTVIEEKRKSIENLEKEFKKKSRELEGFLKTFNFDGYKIEDEDKIKKDNERSKGVERELENIEHDISSLKSNLQDSRNKQKEIEEKEKEIEKDIYGLNKKIDTLKNTLFYVKDYERIPSPLECKRKAEELDKKIREIEGTYDKLDKECKRLSEELAKIEGRKEQLKNNQKGLNEELNSINKKIEKRLSKSRFKSIKEIEEILKEKLNIENLSKKVEEFFKDLETTNQMLKEIKNILKDKKYSKEEHENLINQIESKKSHIEKISIEKGKLKKELETLQDKLQKRKKLEKEKSELEKRKDNLELLKKLFMGKKFVNFASRVYLKSLCELANKRFYALTNKQLKIELDDDNNFIVRDYLNNGKTRHIKTLSGGQLFQASLSLALALSDTITQNQFFFLDEGFGTLDGDSLAKVIETLRNLQKEGKIIGIISHIDELQQEIDDFILVKLDETKGSIIQEIHR